MQLCHTRNTTYRKELCNRFIAGDLLKRFLQKTQKPGCIRGRAFLSLYFYYNWFAEIVGLESRFRGVIPPLPRMSAASGEHPTGLSPIRFADGKDRTDSGEGYGVIPDAGLR